MVEQLLVEAEKARQDIGDYDRIGKNIDSMTPRGNHLLGLKLTLGNPRYLINLAESIMLFGMFIPRVFGFPGIKGCPAPQRWCQEFDNSILRIYLQAFQSACVVLR